MSDASNGSSSDDPQVRIHVHSDPDAETMAVIVATVRGHLRNRDHSSGEHDTVVERRSSRWARAGRREAMRGRDVERIAGKW